MGDLIVAIVQQIVKVDVAVLAYDRKKKGYILNDNYIYKRSTTDRDTGEKCKERRKIIYIERRGDHYNSLIPPKKEMDYSDSDKTEGRSSVQHKEGVDEEKSKARDNGQKQKKLELWKKKNN